MSIFFTLNTIYIYNFEFIQITFFRMCQFLLALDTIDILKFILILFFTNDA